MTILTTLSVTVITKIPVIDFSNEECLKPGTSSWLSVSKEPMKAWEFRTLQTQKKPTGSHISFNWPNGNDQCRYTFY
ncbi:hypothetical protein M0R45_011350 [Rubus argutus]|uniref:Uncharacterized protein n=1 Tax=Rubus argutus TaxID=59490 RepID=A0AAW1Y9M4_RUBAR